MTSGVGWVRCISVVVAASASCASAASEAKWLRATSDHFIVYSSVGEKELRKTATQLEQFDGVMRILHNIGAPTAEAGTNRVTVYIVDDASDVRKLMGKESANVAGFYVPRVNGSIAFTPRSGGADGNLRPQIVLFHEYAHHFLLGTFAAAYPAWFSEGYAEFVSTARFEKDGVMVGVAAQHRAYSLLRTRGLSAERLFDTGSRRLSDEDRASLYARGWLLTHYIMFDAARGATFGRYLDALNKGVPSVAAAQAAFGDLRALDRALDAYLARSTIPGIKIAYSRLPDTKVTVEPLSTGAEALMNLRMESERGVNRQTAQPIYGRAKAIAAAYPNDAVAQGWFAEMAYDAVQDDDAEAAADRALAADPKMAQALLYKARIHLRRASAGSVKDPEAWKEARSWIVKANRLALDDAEALSLYYDSFRAQRAPPTKAAIIGVKRALELVPQDPGLRFRVATQEIRDGDADDAKRTLRPLAFNPHLPADNPAARLITILESGKIGPDALRSLGQGQGETADPPPPG